MPKLTKSDIKRLAHLSNEQLEAWEKAIGLNPENRVKSGARRGLLHIRAIVRRELCAAELQRRRDEEAARQGLLLGTYYNAAQMLYIEGLRQQIENRSVPMAVVDYAGKSDGLGMVTEKTNVLNRRFGTRDMNHVAIYGLKTIWLNHAASREQR